MRMNSAALLLCSALAAATPALAGPGIANGSFEQTSTQNGGSTPGYVCGQTFTPCVNLTGWTNTDGYSFIGNSSNPTNLGIGPNGALNLWAATGSPDGGNFLAIDSDTSRTKAVKGSLGRGTLSQTITGLVVGDNYAVSFYQAAAQQQGFFLPTTDQFQVSLGSTTLFSSLMSLPGVAQGGSGSTDFSGWELETLVFNATSTSELLSFFGIGTVGGPPFILLDGVSIADVPEPGTWAVVGAGLLGLLVVQRRRAAAGKV